MTTITKINRWKPFSLGNESFFCISATKSGIDKNKLLQNSNKTYPYVTRTENNNGVSNFVSKQVSPLNPGNTISIGLDTQSVFYHENAYYTGQNIQVLKTAVLNFRIALFLIPLIKKQLDNLNWGGNGATLTRLRAKKIMLPADDDGSPNWQLMDAFIAEMIGKYTMPVLEVSEGRTLSLNDKKWAPFDIKTIATVFSGHDYPKPIRAHGPVPFVASSSENNGITDFIEDFQFLKKHEGQNVISINRNGSVGYAFYHSYKAYFSGDTRFIKLKKLSDSPEVNLFITLQIKMQKNKFSYGYKMGTERIKNQKIMLPVTSNNDPDWQFMEDYIKSLPNANLI